MGSSFLVCCDLLRNAEVDEWVYVTPSATGRAAYLNTCRRPAAIGGGVCVKSLSRPHSQRKEDSAHHLENSVTGVMACGEVSAGRRVNHERFSRFGRRSRGFQHLLTRMRMLPGLHMQEMGALEACGWQWLRCQLQNIWRERRLEDVALCARQAS